MGKLKIIPFNQYQTTGADYLKNLLTQGTPDIPVQQIADLTPIQQLIMTKLPEMLEGSDASTLLAKAELEKTLTGDYDPRTGDFYKGLRQEADILGQEGMTEIAQKANLGGMFSSTPRVGAQAKFLANTKNNLLQQLGLLYENERSRRMDAAKNIQNVDAAQISNVAAVGGLADTERQVEQARSDALYNAAMQQITFPYTYMSDLAKALYGMQNDYVIKDKEKSLGSSLGTGALKGYLAGVGMGLAGLPVTGPMGALMGMASEM